MSEKDVTFEGKKLNFRSNVLKGIDTAKPETLKTKLGA